METRTYILALLVAISILFGGVLVEAANSTSPTYGEVGTTATLTVDGFGLGTTYDVLLGTVDTGANLVTDGTGAGSVSLTIPEIIASATPYTFNLKDAAAAVHPTTVTFKVNNSAPDITTSSLTIKVGATSIGTALVSDKNGKELVSCQILTSEEAIINKIVEAPNAAKDGCTLTFNTADKPTASNIGTYSFDLKVYDGTAYTTETLSLIVEDYLQITETDYEDKTGDSKTHIPGDTIVISVTVENTLDVDVETVVVSLDNSDLELDDEESEDFTVESDNDATGTVEFMIPYDADEGTYIINIDVSGKDEDGVTRSATDTYSFKVSRETHDLAITDLKFDSTELTCGDTAILSFNLINVGDKDEEDVTILVKNTELGIEEEFKTIDLDSGDDEKVSGEITFPKGAYDGTFELIIEVGYSGKTEVEKKTVSLSECDGDFITIEEEEIGVDAGDNILLKLNLVNIASKKQDFKVKLVGLTNIGTYAGAASLDKISIDAGSDKDVEITIDTNDTAATGAHTVDVEIYIGGEKVATKSVTLNVAEGGWLTGFAISAGSVATYGIVIVVIVGVVVAGYLAYTLWLKEKLFSTEEKPKKSKKRGNIEIE